MMACVVGMMVRGRMVGSSRAGRPVGLGCTRYTSPSSRIIYIVGYTGAPCGCLYGTGVYYLILPVKHLVSSRASVTHDLLKEVRLLMNLQATRLVWVNVRVVVIKLVLPI